MKKLLIANRGEIAIRIARTAAELGVTTLVIHPQDDAQSLHVRYGDEARLLTGTGAAAYLDIDQIVTLARDADCDAIHPGYGFLSENAAFATACEDAGLHFVGPRPKTLSLFGDKSSALAFADQTGVPVLPGTRGATTLEAALAFFDAQGPEAAVMLKALAGGGGRGMRPVTSRDALPEAFERCRSEAQASFGDGALYIERLLPKARHVEVQILGDGTGATVHFWDRECSLQRQRQKVVEIAPAVGLDQGVRGEILAAAVRMASAAWYRGLGTFEFLVNVAAGAPRFVFMEANPRLQVEHTITEEVTGLDLVRLQLQIAGGAKLSALGFDSQSAVPDPRGVALQARINMETMTADGQARPSGGVITAYEPPSGPGIRVDGYGYAGYRTNPRYDSLLAKLITHATDLRSAAAKARRGLGEFRLTGITSNIGFLQVLTQRLAEERVDIHTRFIEENIAELALTPEGRDMPAAEASSRVAGARVDRADPLAVIAHGKMGAARATDVVEPDTPPLDPALMGPEGACPLRAPMQGTIVSISVEVGAAVRKGEQVAIMEAMKMEHVITADISGYVRDLTVAEGDTVFEGHPLAFIDAADVGEAGATETVVNDLDEIRADLQHVVDRHAKTLDAARPEAVARRRKTGHRTARENVDDLFDSGSFIEYGALTLAARRARNSLQGLIDTTPADGLIMGLGQVNGQFFDESAARCAVMAYDYTVLAGTQGVYNHHKMDRMIDVAQRSRLPTVFFCEGGGGRPGDTEGDVGFAHFSRGFELWGKMSAVAPTVGITTGRCFAGNASVLGCCDVIIATKDANIGMGGPAMVEGGGLGVFRPEDIGPVEVQEPSGVIDIVVEDEAAAVATAKQYLSYFQGALQNWSCPDQRHLRRVIPENRLRVYDIRELIRILADEGSFLEIRPKFGATMITALIRLEGRPMGLMANNPKVLGGAIDADGSDKVARFMQICEAYDLPILSLVDTPGMMVGPEIEKTALVRHCSRLFVIGANLTVPLLSVVLRKSYGLGGIAMTGGSYPATMFSVAWPTGEFGAMGIEGLVKLGYRKELAAIVNVAERRAKFDQMVADAYERGKAINRASVFGQDDVIDPADTRRWIVGALKSLPPPPPREHKKLRWIDAW